MSKASSDRVDKDRSISELTTRKRFGAKVDFLFEGSDYELGAIEVGCRSDVNGNKCLTVASLKLPKTLKDMFGSLAEIAPGKIREAKTVGFILSGMKI